MLAVTTTTWNTRGKPRFKVAEFFFIKNQGYGDVLLGCKMSLTEYQQNLLVSLFISLR